MILQALTRYYDILASDPNSGIAPPGYSMANVSFALQLSPAGELTDIFPLVERVERGNRTVEVPQRMLVPEQAKRSSGISPNFLCDSSAYVLGISGKQTKDPRYAQRCFEAFRELNVRLLERIDCPAARAVTAFLTAYDPDAADLYPEIARHRESLLERGGNLVFKLTGESGFVHEASHIQEAWLLHRHAKGKSYVGQCLVTGKMANIARLHPALKGIRGGQPTGTTLVGFNDRAYESYNRVKGQGLNSPVGERAAFAYGTALNYLLSRENPNPVFTIGDTTVVYWAESPNPGYAAAFAGLFEVNEPAESAAQDEASQPSLFADRQAEERVGDILQRVRRGEALDRSQLLAGLEPDTRFYILGLAPNAGRAAVRFFHTDAFGKVVDKIMAHYADLQIEKEYEDQPSYPTLRQILWETVSRKAANPEVAPLLGGAVFRAILENTPYPAALYYALINRIRTDMDDSERRIRKINYLRAAAIKAYLIRRYRNQEYPKIKEVLTMSLNEQATNQAYLLGRLFAVLEKAQQEAIGENIDATIKDRYFTSACAAPRSVFPVLLRLSQHHISRAEYGKSLDSRIQEIMNLLDVESNPFPARLSLDEQGIFVLGYYHQRKAFYTPRENKIETEA